MSVEVTGFSARPPLWHERILLPRPLCQPGLCSTPFHICLNSAFLVGCWQEGRHTLADPSLCVEGAGRSRQRPRAEKAPKKRIHLWNREQMAPPLSRGQPKLLASMGDRGVLGLAGTPPAENRPPILPACGSTFSLGSRPRARGAAGAVDEVWSGNPSEASLPASVYGFIIASRLPLHWGSRAAQAPAAALCKSGPGSSRDGR